MKKIKNEKVRYVSYTSSKLGFSISIPSNWKVNTDRLEAEPGTGPSWEEAYKTFRQTFLDSAMTLEDFKKQATELPREKEIPAEEAYEKLLKQERAKAIKIEEFKKIYEQDKKQAYRTFFEKLLGMPPDEIIEEFAARELSAEEAYTRLMADPETFLVSLAEFKEQYEWEQEQRKEAERRREELAQMEVGYFEASPPNDEDYPSVEVTQLKLIRPVTPLELYQLDKPSSEAVPWGNRPSKGITVDGLQGVKYYYIFDTGETRNMTEMPQFFNVYLTEGQMGWIISCSCTARAFSKYKGIFITIIDNFRRI